ncbi:hypothetical protein LJC38_06910 [Parabacteroides sp. OttesenSCG-928-K15]|nr:hypothetical protein [Parabacteroides sp. OttesenSCG-928-K15]
MKKLRYTTDRMINSTENNGYAEGYRDENLIEQNLLDTEIPEDDMIPDVVSETRVAGREVYNEEGYGYEYEN